MKRSFSRWLPPLLLAALYVLACAGYTRLSGDPLGIGLGWNLVLAALPLVFGRLALHCSHALPAAVCWLFWLLLLPNAFYFVTDLLHAPAGMEWLESNAAGQVTVQHSSEFTHWLLLVILGGGMFFAWLLGCLALDCLTDTLRRRAGTAAAWAGAAVACLACGAGIYIGRFLRLNSWDVFRPALLLQKLAAAVHPDALRLALLFGGTALFTYAVYRALVCLTHRSE